jgi:hypothetical protein
MVCSVVVRRVLTASYQREASNNNIHFCYPPAGVKLPILSNITIEVTDPPVPGRSKDTSSV